MEGYMQFFKRIPISLTLAALTILILASPANASVCPAVGSDTDCGVIITVTDTGSSIYFTGQGPYDGIEDTLVGVINNSKIPINTLGISAALTVFGFDGDGLRGYGIAGNTFDSTGYGGPNAYFTKISSSLLSGTVNFITPITPLVGTGYFSLENPIASATACQDIINKSVAHSVAGGTTITAIFTPNRGNSLSQAEQLCGFVNFDWQQKIKNLPLPNPFFQVATPKPKQLYAPPLFFDPPPGGYTYPSSTVGSTVDLSYPFYYDAISNGGAELLSHETPNTLSFSDAPADPCLPGGNSVGVAGCYGKHAPKGSYIAFMTHLAGVNSDGTATDLGIGFTWKDTFNGTSGGIATTKNNNPVDAGSGTGGITILSVQNVTNYKGIAITSVNGGQLGAPPLLESGSACNGTYSGTFEGDITVSAGQNCTFVDGTITGDIENTGGNLALTGTLVGGDIEIEGASTFSIGPFTEIKGNLNIHSIPTGTTLNQVCSTTVHGNLKLQNNGVPIQIGSASAASCDGNVIVGNVDIQNNVGQISVVNNTITENLRCEDNTSITGSGNTAERELGHCFLSPKNNTDREDTQ